MNEKRFKSRCYEKQKNVVIYDEGNKLFDVSYRDFEDAYYLKMKLSPVIDKLNELSEENKLYKERISLLSSLLDLADAIIDTSDNEKAKQVWDNKNEQTEKEWEEILNERKMEIH